MSSMYQTINYRLPTARYMEDAFSLHVKTLTPVAQALASHS
jgi:hypothetical protein